MTAEETLEQIKKELFFNLENMRNQIESLDDKVTNIKDEIQKDQKVQEKDFEHFKERVDSKIENMRDNINWIKIYTDSDKSDKKEKKQNKLTIIGIIIAIIGIIIAIIIGILNFCGITLQSVVK